MESSLNPLRPLWLLLGFFFVALGFIGAAVPGMPSTVFFVLAAYFFSRSSRRFLNWLLSLPKVGPLVRDYRSGLGMPRKAKIIALHVEPFCPHQCNLPDSGFMGEGSGYGAGSGGFLVHT